ncbi:hypothetical protein MNBD_GAMMA16-1876 [hydrothermal vent metagenome]|uniref:Peptidase M10 metallopeptidase domain-containing protein n=1 Tax=hydrothermal vent metagenome TaxID=652676 RepID=A0A3B0ZM57_9ZZZZ
MNNKWYFLCIMFFTVLLTKQAWGFAFFVVNDDVLEISATGTPVIWEEKNVAIGININRQPLKQQLLDGMLQWNNTGANITLVEGQRTGLACVHGDGLNNVELSQNICGRDWGDTLGITTLSSLTFGDATYLTEADILLRSFDSDPTRKWAANSDPLIAENFYCYQNNQGGETCDFARVVLHELGHAIGLNHPDEIEQSVKAIMNSGNTQNQTGRILAADDIAGIRTLYPNNRDAITRTAGLESLPSNSDNSNGGGAINLGLLLGLLCLIRKRFW